MFRIAFIPETEQRPEGQSPALKDYVFGDHPAHLPGDRAVLINPISP